MTSSPAERCLATTSATAWRSASARSVSSTGCPAAAARIRSSSAGGRARLPTCVVKMRSVLRCMAARLEDVDEASLAAVTEAAGAGHAALAAAAARARSDPGSCAVVLVEGMSDQAAVQTLAERSGRDLRAEGVFVVPMGGACGTRIPSRNLHRPVDDGPSRTQREQLGRHLGQVLAHHVGWLERRAEPARLAAHEAGDQ